MEDFNSSGENSIPNADSKFIKSRATGGSFLDNMKPKTIAILLIVILVISVFILAGIGFLSIKEHNRTDMVKNFQGGGMYKRQGGQFFNNQQPSSSN
jgi:hypothetical protein